MKKSDKKLDEKFTWTFFFCYGFLSVFKKDSYGFFEKIHMDFLKNSDDLF